MFKYKRGLLRPREVAASTIKCDSEGTYSTDAKFIGSQKHEKRHESWQNSTNSLWASSWL